MLLSVAGGVGRRAEGHCKRLAKSGSAAGFSSCMATYWVKHLQLLFPNRGNSEYQAEKTVLRITTLKKKKKNRFAFLPLSAELRGGRS